MENLATYKDLQDFGNLDLLARQVVEGFITGLHKSPFHGFSVEFAEHRLYNTGDSVKNIDWKLYGRTDRLFVKRFEEETNLRCQLVLDASSSMYFPEKRYNKLLFSVYAAAALVYLLQKQRDAFGLTTFTDHITLSTAAKSTVTHQKYLFAELEKLMRQTDLHQKTSVAAVLHQVAEQVHKRSLIVVFSDWLQPGTGRDSLTDIFSALQHLKYNKHEVILFNVTDAAKEQNLEFENRPHHFIDMESGEDLKINPLQVREHYINQMTAYQKELELKCAQYHIDLVHADINQGFYPVLHNYLIKRAKMG
ncbi:DUF58 domain-containing protein (plasmid) [Pedobacter sp. BS3]|uniref:DUF58 domain-containing protein n=1 Tax=Pedobacter sp. BS3 TaxID=2567937 RepID=UPI0011F01555|nr:DUF58 domain-containing protein [Pedobacter sp. BS3]TZF86406.1 DUF58 domain-containing protein [Pedobacter sp. BS3]